KPKDRATRLRQSQALDALFRPRIPIPEKVLIQEELGYMRRMLQGDREEIDLTYPVNPPYAFVRVWFDRTDGALEYSILEPTLREGEAEKLVQIRGKMEAMMAQEELPVAEHLTFEGSPELHEYL